MKLSSISIQGNQGYIEGTGKENEVISEGLKNGMKEISGKTPGQTVSGEVVAKNGNDLLISIGKDQLLHAKLDSSVLVEQGSQMTFAIKALTGSKVVLSPLFTNTATDPNVSKALQMAGIPETETSVKMVQTMMQEGMSIDKNSLQQMMRSVNLNPGANMDTLVQLERLQIPITEDSIFQMEAYKNYEHQMTESLLSIADALTETVQGMAAEGNMAEGITLYKEIFALLTEQAKELTGGADGKMQMPVDEDGNPVLDVKNGMNEEQSLQNMKSEAELMPKSGEQLSDAGKSILSGQEKEALVSQLKQAGFEELGNAFSKGQLSDKELLGQLNRLMSGNQVLSDEVMKDTMKLFGGKEFQKLLKNEMTNQWLLSPEEVGQENKVERLYERLNQQMSRLSQALEQTAQANTSLGKAVSNVTTNIDFMNQLNQMFTYVQLPLKMQGQEASGDLYVYTNKRSLAQKEGEVSALLHLDMEHLGCVDVHVALRDNTKVSTQFYLQDDSTLDLIAEHIDMLNERLEKRGYSMTASFIQRDEGENVMEEILKQDKNISVLSGCSFDARA